MPEPIHEQKPMIFPDRTNQMLYITMADLAAIVNTPSAQSRNRLADMVVKVQERRGNIQGTFWEEKKRPGRIVEVTDARYMNDPKRIMIHTRASPGKWIQGTGSIIKRSSLRQRFIPVASPIKSEEI